MRNRLLVRHPLLLSSNSFLITPTVSISIEITPLQEALNTLKRHNVVEEIEGHWHIIVELFRQWVLQL